LTHGGRVADAGCDGFLRRGEEPVERDGDLNRGVAVAGLDLDLDGIGLAGGEGEGGCERGKNDGGGGGGCEEQRQSHLGWVVGLGGMRPMNVE
jgi:hypothetical protein